MFDSIVLMTLAMCAIVFTGVSRGEAPCSSSGD